jgi:DNA-binding CsgD family transcriptional regulator
MLGAVVRYAVPLGLGAVALTWLQHRYWIGVLPGEAYLAVIAVGAAMFGAWLARVLLPSARADDFIPDAEAIRSLGLSPRELEVLAVLAAGDSNKVMARRLGISPHTVKTHVGRVCEKLGVQRRGQAVDKARALALIP